MTRMIRGSVLLAACVGIWSCSSDPTADEAGVPCQNRCRTPAWSSSSRTTAELISFQLVDELDGGVPSTWTIGATPARTPP